MIKKGLFVFGILFVFLISFSCVSAVQYTNCTAVPSAVRDEGGITRTCREVSACGTLNTANSYYLAMNDLNSLTTCLVLVSIDNSILDLNEYTINYNILDVNPPNTGFEEALAGDETKPAYWDISQAPNVTRVYTTDYLFGNYYIRINSTQPNTISSQLISLPQPTGNNPPGSNNNTYFAQVVAKGGYTSYSTIFIEVVDEFNNILCYRESGNYERDSTQFCRFSTNEPKNVYLRFGTLLSNNRNYSFDLASISSSFDLGIVDRRYTDFERAPDNPEATGESINVIIKNGKIIQGAGKGLRSPAFDLPSVISLKLINTYSETNGINSVNGLFGANNEIAYNYFNTTSPYVISRLDLGYPQIGGSGTNSLIHDNFLTGAPQRAIQFGGTNGSIYNNVIKSRATATNNHAIGLRGVNNFSVYNNTIEPYNGRGISLEAGVDYTLVYNNFINVTEVPSMEYGTTNYDTGCAHGIKVEDRVNNTKIFNNTVISRTGPGTWGGCPLNMGLELLAGEIIDIENNTFIALYGFGSPPNTFVSALYYNGDFSNVILKNNKFYSNHQFIKVFESPTTGLNAISNTFTQTGPAILPFQSIYIDAYGTTLHGSQFINQSFIGGALDDVTIESHTQDWDYSIKWFLDTVVQTFGGLKLSGANVVIRDKDNAVIYSGTTDSSGFIENNLTEYLMSGVSTTINLKVYSSPYNITVTYLGQTQSRLVTLNHSLIETFYFGGKNPDVNGDGFVNVIDLAIVIFNQGRNPVSNPNYAHLDLNEDNAINFEDVELVMNYI